MRKKYHLYSSMPMLGNHKAYAEIDSRALKHNYRIMLNDIHKNNENTVAICVLKADAYGHGAKNCCRALLEEGCRHFAGKPILFIPVSSLTWHFTRTPAERASAASSFA